MNLKYIPNVTFWSHWAEIKGYHKTPYFYTLTAGCVYGNPGDDSHTAEKMLHYDIIYIYIYIYKQKL